MTDSERDRSAPDLPPAPPHDVWADGAAYERFMGRWSRPVARAFLAWLAVPPDARWLDAGCGTGVLAHTILQEAEPRAVLAIDRSDGFVAVARATIRDQRAQFAVADLQALSDAPAAYDAVVSGLVLNFLPNPQLALRHLVQATRPGGIIGAYVWDYAGEMQFLRHFWEAAIELAPQAAALDEGRRFPLCHPQALSDLFQGAGLAAVETRAIEIATTFVDFDDYWSPFLGGQGPAASYVTSLHDSQRAALRERLQQRLAYAPDGAIPLTARAWAVRGTR